MTMSQQPPPLPFTEPPPLPLQQDEELLPFNEPPPLPLQPSLAAQPIPLPSKEGRLNPNITFLLGIWVGIGLCSVAFCFLAISGRFEPFVRWIQKTAKDLESSDSAQPSDESPSATTDEKADEPPTTPEPVKSDKPKPNSNEFREGFATGENFGRKLGSTAFAQGRRVGEDELRGVLDGVRQFDNPYPEGSSKADDWLIGWEDGARAGLGKNLTKE